VLLEKDREDQLEVRPILYEINKGYKESRRREVS